MCLAVVVEQYSQRQPEQQRQDEHAVPQGLQPALQGLEQAMRIEQVQDRDLQGVVHPRRIAYPGLQRLASASPGIAGSASSIRQRRLERCRGRSGRLAPRRRGGLVAKACNLFLQQALQVFLQLLAVLRHQRMGGGGQAQQTLIDQVDQHRIQLATAEHLCKAPLIAGRDGDELLVHLHHLEDEELPGLQLPLQLIGRVEHHIQRLLPAVAQEHLQPLAQQQWRGDLAGIAEIGLFLRGDIAVHSTGLPVDRSRIPALGAAEVICLRGAKNTSQPPRGLSM